MLPVEIFNDPINGYIFEGDQCEFGVDVMQPLPSGKSSLLIRPISPKSLVLSTMS